MLRTEPSQDFEAIHPGQAHVENEKIELAHEDATERGFSILNPDAIVSCLDQSGRNLPREAGIVFDNQDAHRV